MPILKGRSWEGRRNPVLSVYLPLTSEAEKSSGPGISDYTENCRTSLETSRIHLSRVHWIKPSPIWMPASPTCRISKPPPLCLTGIDTVLLEAAERLRDNYPYFHPLYAGQMLKPPHPVARAAYALATWINPNNHALDGGRASSAMEKEAVAQIAAMFGWNEFLGHLTGGGTMANLEALWVAGRLNPGKTILASAGAHYTHERISSVCNCPSSPFPPTAGRSHRLRSA